LPDSVLGNCLTLYRVSHESGYRDYYYYFQLTHCSLQGLSCDLGWTFQLSPPGVATSVTTREHPAAEGGTVGEKYPAVLPKCRFPRPPKPLYRDYTKVLGPGQLSLYSDSLRAGRSWDRIPVGARYSAPVQTGPGAHPASYTMGTGSFPGVKRPGRGVDHPPPHLAPRLKKE
jgi:hypothetical protein